MLHIETKNSNQKNYCHSGDLGDIIYSLPVIKFKGAGGLSIRQNMQIIDEKLRYFKIMRLDEKKEDNTLPGIDKDKFEFIKPLLVNQKFITDCKYGDPEGLFTNLDYFRKDTGHNNLIEKYQNVFSVPESLYETPWIETYNRHVSDIIISRTNRYHNKNFPWKEIIKKYKNNLTFIGLESEHALFCEKFEKVNFYKIKDALEASAILSACTLFIGNQNVFYAIAEALKKSCIQETSTYKPDCIFARSDSIYFTQNKFIKLVQEKI